MLLPIFFLIQEANADAFTYSSLIVSDDTGSGFRQLQSGTPVVAANTTANLCPSAYGYAYQDGGRCCASEFDAYDDYLTISSRTCSEGDSAACASESCEKNTGAATSARASTVSCGTGSTGTGSGSSSSSSISTTTTSTTKAVLVLLEVNNYTSADPCVMQLTKIVDL